MAQTLRQGGVRTDDLLSSVRNAARVLREFTSRDRILGISELSRRTGLSKSTVSRLVSTLTAEGFLAPTEQRRYRLGFHLYALGSLGWSSTLRTHAYAVMRDLRDAVEETIQLCVLDGEEIVCMERMEPPRAYYELSAWRVPVEACSAGAILTPEGGKRSGPPAVDEDGSGIVSISAPILDGNGVVAALSVVAPGARLTRSAIARNAPLLSDSVARLSAHLGFRGGNEPGRFPVVVGDGSAWTE